MAAVDDGAQAQALELELRMLDEGIAWADVCARYAPDGDAARRAQAVMPQILARYGRAVRARRALIAGGEPPRAPPR